jgi:3-phenylpropionate/trans-cinnamate dioxygenase ferredoxin component
VFMTRVRAGDLSEFPVGAQKSLEVGSDYVLVLHSPSGFWAIEDRCSHDDNELYGGEVEERGGAAPRIKCLRHGAWFDLSNGKALTLPAFKAVKSYQILIEETTVWVVEKVQS